MVCGGVEPPKNAFGGDEVLTSGLCLSCYFHHGRARVMTMNKIPLAARTISATVVKSMLSSVVLVTFS